jgi:hypothetical protein
MMLLWLAAICWGMMFKFMGVFYARTFTRREMQVRISPTTCLHAPPPHHTDENCRDCFSPRLIFIAICCEISTAFTMPSYEAKLLSDFLIVPASLREFMTLRQFTDIFPKGHRTNPAIKELYQELYTLRERDVELVRQDIAEEVKRSKQLKREHAKKRRETDEANVAGLNPIALQMEQEVRTSLLPSLGLIAHHT